MPLSDLFFYLFAFMTLFCGVMVVANPFSRNPVTSAIFLVLTILSMSGLFVLLHAFFLVAVQVIVYAGAVIVLFLFVLMLLDLKEEERRKIKVVSAGIGALAVLVIAGLFVKSITGLDAGTLAVPTVEGTVSVLGKSLFQNFLLPFEIVSVLLLVAMIGVILLSKKDLK